MDDVIKELWGALKTLSGPQWVVLLALSMFIGTALFRVFRWLYSSRLEAQGSLIDLKDRTIEHYKSVHAESSRTRPLSEVVPEEWAPFLEQPFQQLEELLKQTQQQQTMNYTSANMGFVLDAQLYILYLKAYHMLPPERAAQFKREQDLWLRQRKAFCEASVQSGGTLASLEYSMAFISRTQERLEELKS
jgi:uncharacterized protein YecT (DUF1311 family)